MNSNSQMSARGRMTDVLIGVMTITMVIIIVLIVTQVRRSGNDTQSKKAYMPSVSEVMPVRYLQGAELKVFMESNDPAAQAIRTYLASTSTNGPL